MDGGNECIKCGHCNCGTCRRIWTSDFDLVEDSGECNCESCFDQRTDGKDSTPYYPPTEPIDALIEKVAGLEAMVVLLVDKVFPMKRPTWNQRKQLKKSRGLEAIDKYMEQYQSPKSFVGWKAFAH